MFDIKIKFDIFNWIKEWREDRKNKKAEKLRHKKNSVKEHHAYPTIEKK